MEDSDDDADDDAADDAADDEDGNGDFVEDVENVCMFGAAVELGSVEN